MLTKNFYSALSGALYKSSNDMSPNSTVTLFDGSAWDVGIIAKLDGFQTAFKTAYTSKAGAGVVFGSGTTAPTPEDYKLESIILADNLAFSTPNETRFDRGDGFDEYTTSIGVRNKTNEDITVGEIGLVLHLNTGSTSPKYALVDRTVLDEPVTIPAGESRQITYTIRFNYGA